MVCGCEGRRGQDGKARMWLSVRHDCLMMSRSCASNSSELRTASWQELSRLDELEIFKVSGRVSEEVREPRETLAGSV